MFTKAKVMLRLLMHKRKFNNFLANKTFDSIDERYHDLMSGFSIKYKLPLSTVKAIVFVGSNFNYFYRLRVPETILQKDERATYKSLLPYYFQFYSNVFSYKFNISHEELKEVFCCYYGLAAVPYYKTAPIIPMYNLIKPTDIFNHIRASMDMGMSLYITIRKSLPQFEDTNLRDAIVFIAYLTNEDIISNIVSTDSYARVKPHVFINHIKKIYADISDELSELFFKFLTVKEFLSKFDRIKYR